MRILRTVILAIGLAAVATACGGKSKPADTSNTGGDNMGTDDGGDAYGGDMYGAEEGGGGEDEGGME
jgi:hypothetical protein